MSIYVAGAATAVSGFHGKLPARGDFVRAGLPSSFVVVWDDWMARVIAGSQHILGDSWRPAWFEAPIWRFALSAGVCGPAGVVGVFMPSVDRAGRMYPLTLGAVVDATDARALADGSGDFLAAAEAAGLDALEHDLEPDVLAERMREALTGSGSGHEGPPPPAENGSTMWWTEGGPRVPNAAFAHAGLPGSDIFAWMVDANPTGPLPPPADPQATDTEAAP